MEDLFYFQEIYLHTNNYDIINFKKILEINDTYDNIYKLKKQFVSSIKKNIKNVNYTCNIKNFILDNNIFVFDNIFQYISNFNFDNNININDIDYEFINKIYNIKLNESQILKKIYDKKIIIKNENEFSNLFKIINLKNFKYFDLFSIYYKVDDNLIKNISKIEESFRLTKNTRIFKFYKKIFANKNYEDDDLIYFLLYEKYELNIDNFVKSYNDVKIKHKFNSLKNFYAFYFTNFEKFNIIVSEKLFQKLFKNFDLTFFKNTYYNLLRSNDINITNNLDIYNFYFKNNDLITNIDNFNNIFKNIDQKFIKSIYLKKSANFTNYIEYVINNKNILLNFRDFINNFSNFNISIYLKNTKLQINDNYDIVKEMIEKKKYINYSIKYDKNIDYNFIYDYYKLKNLSKDEINLLLLNKNFIYNIDEYQKVNNICLTFIKIFNNLLQKFDDKTLIKKLLENKNDYILNIDKFKEKYLNLIKKKEKYLNNIHKYKLEIKNINSNDDLIKYFKKSVYNSYININYVGRKNIFIIEEVIEDLKLQKKELKDGISLIIRAKNEEKNIKMCIESVVDLVDEIIFVNNNSTDNTLKIIENLALKYDNIKVYNYFIDVSKVGIEHNNALKNNDFNTLGNYYNWCLSKSRMKNVIKWDADFICIRNNFISMIKNLKIRNKYNNYAVWFSGYTLFINNNNYYINLKSYYNEFRLFSYYNGFKWYDGDLCEFNEPYLNKCSDKIYVYDPIFYELKRTDLDEFDSRSSLIDNRDKNDFNILSNLKNNKSMNNLYNINYNLINYDLNILLIVNSFDFGGSNFFIIELYNYFKTHGYNIKIYTYKLKKNNKNYHKINYYDIFDINEINLINNINNFDYVFLNSFIPNDIKDNISDFKTKFIFITHSDVAYSNKYIKEYNNYFYKIITVNNITKNKLIRLLDIDHSKIYKIINYSNINNDSKIDFNRTKKFGVITRFSEDKNIVMLLFALKKFFNIYNDYLFYLVGYENEYMQNYLLYLIDYLELKNFIKVEGYQNDVKKYYELLDFIILPSVSEGASYNLIESMSYQKLIVVSNVGGNHELLNNNCLYIEYDGIKEYEYDNLYIENYNKQLNLLGYVTINDHKDFYNKFELNVEYDFKNINNIPSIFIEKGTDKFDNDYIDLLKSKWDKNIYNILDSVIKAIKLNDQKKQKIINNNYEYIKNNYNIINYYKNIDDILDLSI